MFYTYVTVSSNKFESYLMNENVDFCKEKRERRLFFFPYFEYTFKFCIIFHTNFTSLITCSLYLSKEHFDIFLYPITLLGYYSNVLYIKRKYKVVLCSSTTYNSNIQLTIQQKYQIATFLIIEFL